MALYFRTADPLYLCRPQLPAKFVIMPYPFTGVLFKGVVTPVVFTQEITQSASCVFTTSEEAKMKLIVNSAGFSTFYPAPIFLNGVLAPGYTPGLQCLQMMSPFDAVVAELVRLFPVKH